MLIVSKSTPLQVVLIKLKWAVYNNFKHCREFDLQNVKIVIKTCIVQFGEIKFQILGQI